MNNPPSDNIAVGQIGKVIFHKYTKNWGAGFSFRKRLNSEFPKSTMLSFDMLYCLIKIYTNTLRSRDNRCRNIEEG